MFWIITLILLGLFLLIVEFLLIPGVTVAGIGGMLVIVYAVYSAYVDHGTTTGHITLIFTAIASIITIAFSLRAKTWRRVSLDTNVDSKVIEDYDKEVKPGDEGLTISRLAPAGKASINGNVYEVWAQGELVDPKTPITVIKVDTNKIIVKPKQL
ncbi:NfeD family protein [Tenuifilum thalassicum]|uniref:NfeD-like C-terminal domain-containing protein n=1 Tax=Tenuifilum thalassicum TaxID=2590900 RepID=A0A7D4AY32_9BACT|nr:NfeD family protein [Tenuifilum thalassicum]QKG80634.1 hypothetical protein FHG85_10260 [Tenuifilum thalassicum]